MIAAAVLGFLVGLPSRRLIGDYLAIVTLFFGEAFVEFTNNVAPSKLGGPNGITSIDPYKGFGHQITTNKGYFYLLLVLLVVVIAAVHMLDRSRLGRAWRAVREDPLAAGLMTIPVNRVKLMAFSFGAAIAALAGTVFAAQQISVFPTDFDTPYPDPHLRRAHPRRVGLDRRRGDGRADHLDHPRRLSAQPDPGRLHLLRRDRAHADRAGASVAAVGRAGGGHGRARARRCTRSSAPSRTPPWPAARSPVAGSPTSCATG